MSDKPKVGLKSSLLSPNQPPPDQPWVWQSRSLRQSDAWRSAGINARRVIDFLLLEHMRHGGQANGRLKAPHRQLEVFGIGARYVTEAIRETEELGLVDSSHRRQRVASTYALTWLPLYDGTPATNRWKTYHNPFLKPFSELRPKGQPTQGKAELPPKWMANDVGLPVKGRTDVEICVLKGRQNLPSRGKAPSISSYQDGAVSFVLEGEATVLPGSGEGPEEEAGGCPPGKPVPRGAPAGTRIRVVL
jgi:hypothetical protein